MITHRTFFVAPLLGCLSLIACAVGSNDEIGFSSVEQTMPHERAPIFGEQGGPAPATSIDLVEIPTPASDRPALPSISIVGRYDARDPRGPRFGFPGSRIVARFRGSEATVTLEEAAGLDGPSEVDVAIDGVWQSKVVLEQGRHAYVLARALMHGEHTVEIYRRTEAANGITQLVDFDFGAGEMLAPPARSRRRIEIIGDSNPAGFGVEGVGLGPDCPGNDWAARYENFHRSWGALVGQRLDAEISATVYSGKGLVQNAWRPDAVPMSAVFARALPDDPASLWNPALFMPHAVVVMMGGVDFAVGEPVDQGPASIAAVGAAYAKLTREIRGNYPDAHIVLALSPTLNDTTTPERKVRTSVVAAMLEVVADARARSDDRLHVFTPAVAIASELTGCKGHGSPAYHARVADEIASYVAQKLAW